MNNRARSLLDLAHELHECTSCGVYVPHGLNPCHENGIVAGKGQSIKGNDNRHFAGCNACHDFFDGRSNKDPAGFFSPTRESRAEMFNRAHKATFDQYWRNGWISVCK